MATNYPPFTIRIPEPVMNKVRVLAKLNKRSINREIEYLLELHLAEYEKLHGEIAIEQSPAFR